MASATRKMSEGVCSFCSGVFAKAAMGRHLEKCEKRKPEGSASSSKSAVQDAFHMMVEGYGLSRSKYWMHIEASAGAKLSDLDSFLRGIWLECCGHLSMFTIGGMEFISNFTPEDRLEGRKGMNVALDKLLFPGLTFLHEYDFGTTTELAIKVLSRGRSHTKNKIQLLARNNTPMIKCVCGKEAVNLCSQCVWESGEGWLCDDCAKKHECGEDMLLPVLNSPRTGMCGYTG